MTQRAFCRAAEEEQMITCFFGMIAHNIGTHNRGLFGRHEHRHGTLGRGPQVALGDLRALAGVAFDGGLAAGRAARRRLALTATARANAQPVGRRGVVPLLVELKSLAVHHAVRCRLE